MADWLGNTRLENAGGLLGATRRWYLTVTNAEASGDKTPWDFTTGSAVTLYYRTSTTGLSPPDEADTIILEVRRSNGSVLKQLHNGAPPTQGQAFTVDLTDTGNPGGADRAGGLELYVRAIRSGGLSPYDMNSTATGDRGFIRSNAKVSAIAVSAYPAGSTFAYGTAANETITLAVTHTAAFVENEGQARIDALYLTAIQSAGSNQNYNGTTTVQAFTANNTFDDAAKSYGALIAPVGNSFLTPASGAVLWTRLVSVGLEQSGDNVRRQSFYNVDPRITLGTPILSKALVNRGQATTIDVQILNARSEALTRSVGYQLKDSLGTVKKSGSDTGTNYDIDYTIGSGDDASFDFVGVQWTLNTTLADVDSNPSTNAYKVSRKLMEGSAAGLNDLAVVTDYELYNRGETVNLNYYLSYANGEAYASIAGVTTNILNTPNSANEEVLSTATDANGKLTTSYVIANSDVAAADATGTLKRLNAAKSGNTTDNSNSEWSAGSLRLLDLHPQITGVLNKDDFALEDANEDYAGVILGNVIYTWAHVENIRNDGTEIQTSGNALHLEIRDPDGGISITYDFDTTVDGWSDRININPNAPAGDWTYTLTLVDQFNNTATAEHTVTYITPLTSNLSVISMTPVLLLSTQDFEFRVRTEIDNAVSPPEQQPTWRLFDEALTETASGVLRTIVNDTATLDGSIYRVRLSDFPALTAGRYTLQFEAQIQGNPMKEKETFYLVEEKIDGQGFMGYPLRLDVKGS